MNILTCESYIPLLGQKVSGLAVMVDSTVVSEIAIIMDCVKINTSYITDIPRLHLP